MRRRRGRANARFAQKFGTYGHTMTIVERYGPGEELYIIIPARRGEPRIQRSLGVGGMRDANGAIDPERQVRVIEAGARMARGLRAGQHSLEALMGEAREAIGVRTKSTARRPVLSALHLTEARFHALQQRVVQGIATPDESQEFARLAGELVTRARPQGAGTAVGTPGASKDLSVDGAIDAYFEPGTGAALELTDDLRDRRTCVLRLLPDLRAQSATWNALTFVDVEDALRACVARLAAEWPAGKAVPTTYPYLRSLERAVQTLVQVSKFLVRKRLATTTWAVDDEWRARLRKDYETAFPTVNATHGPPRLTPRAYQAVFSACVDPSVDMDPRLRMLLLIGAERRPGQVLRCRRSDLVVDAVTGVPTMLRMRGNRVKPAPDVVFNAEEAAVWGRELREGALRELERNYERTGANYPLLPGGRRPARAAAFSPSGRSFHGITLKQLSALLRDFLVAHPEWDVDTTVEGFGFYALKRAGVDAIKDIDVPESVKDAVTGHVDPGTRIRHYQKHRFSDVDLERAAELRRRARGL